MPVSAQFAHMQWSRGVMVVMRSVHQTKCTSEREEINLVSDSADYIIFQNLVVVLYQELGTSLLAPRRAQMSEVRTVSFFFYFFSYIVQMKKKKKQISI